MSNQPLISIVLPLYNTTPFLKTGLECIKNQTYENWELVAVNDGSTDNTKELFLEITKNWTQKVQLIDRVNGGGFEARNTGLDHMKGDYLALYDVDDRWYDFHLQELLEVMQNYPEIDWLYASNKIIDLTDNDKVIVESNFHNRCNSAKFLSLKTKQLGNAKLIIDSRAAEFQILHGLQLGQQFSLSKKEVFKDYRFRSAYRNEGADQISVIRALKSGFKIAYIDKIHGEYAVHNNNASAGCKGAPLEKYIRLRHALIRGFREAECELDLNLREVKAINKTIADNYFWQLGYNLCYPNMRIKEAFHYFHKGIFYQPLNWRFWKSYLACFIRSTITK